MASAVARTAVLLSFLLSRVDAATVARKPVAPRRAPAAAASESQVVHAWMRSMTLRDKIAQLIVEPCFGENPNVRTADYRRFYHWVHDLHVGGLVVLNRVVRGSVQNAEPYAMAAFLNQMQRLSPLPLIIGSDFERGASMRIANTTKYPHNMAYVAAGDLEASRYEGLETARDARAMGIQWILAPVADVNNNPDNPVINIRSYGEKPEDVAAHVAAYIDGAHSDPLAKVLVTAKHFPGHGDTNTDSHRGLGVVSGDKARLETVELVPFKAAVAHHVDAIMTAHLTVPAWEPEEIPATVSKAVLTDLLRKEMGFTGLIVTDAMDMTALTATLSPTEAAVKAIEAGADILLMPSKPDEVIKAVLKAVETKRLTVKRIDESVEKLLEAKVRVGLNRKRVVDLEALSKVLDSPEAETESQTVADRAVTLVKNDKDIFPVANRAQACLFVLAESRRSREGLRMLDLVAAQAPEMKATLFDPDLSADVFSAAVGQAQTACKEVIVAAFVTVAQYQGNVVMAGGYPGFMQALVSGTVPVGLISLGNPYLLRNFPGVAAYATTYSPSVTSEGSAVKAMLGDMKLTGRLPVTIPGAAKLGDGIQLPLKQ
ncbi:MAG TPA: glycoside hydrolase family 3 N-terminal domain-containing protein [Bryobacteraceae bacterium]